MCNPSRKLSLSEREKFVPISVSLVPKNKGKKKAVKEEIVLNGQALARRMILKDWRKNYAKENDLPAFIIFSDKTLDQLALHNPKNKDELLDIYGFGQMKTESLGEHILRELGHL